VLCDPDSPVFAEVENLRAEWCIRIDGEVKARDPELVNPKLPTGEIEVFIRDMEVLGGVEGDLPLQVFGDQEYPEETRLRYRFLDLRREAMQRQHDAALRRGGLDPPAHVGHGVPRIPDADHHRLQPRGRARLPRALALCIPASSTRCRRRRSSSSSFSWCRASTGISRSRPVSATRTRAPTARPPISTSSTWR
jgi:hypothetical protein